MSAELLYTIIAKCRTCGVEWNRAEHVPASERSRVKLGAPIALMFSAGFDRAEHPCPHSSLSDLNLHIDFEEIEESSDAG